MTLKNIINSIFVEERNGGGFLDFEAFVGEFEGNNIPHFHLENKVRKLKTAIRLDMPYYFLHGDKRYILNSKERKELVRWLSSKIETTINVFKEIPKNNYENLLNMWNNYHPDAISNKVPIASYNMLNRDYKQK